MRLVDLSDELHVGAVEQRFYALREVVSLGSHDLRSDFERHSSGPREMDDRFRAFLRRDAPQEGKIPLGLIIWSQPIFGQTMVDGTRPIRVRQWNALGIGNGNESCVRKAASTERR